jgi:hypothetical protein
MISYEILTYHFPIKKFDTITIQCDSMFRGSVQNCETSEIQLCAELFEFIPLLA